MVPDPTLNWTRGLIRNQIRYSIAPDIQTLHHMRHWNGRNLKGKGIKRNNITRYSISNIIVSTLNMMNFKFKRLLIRNIEEGPEEIDEGGEG